jgi:hypothetical protein
MENVGRGILWLFGIFYSHFVKFMAKWTKNQTDDCEIRSHCKVASLRYLHINKT